ncbi:MAG TPA: DUF4864 domain-containing protein [Nitrospiraceae bacterium]|nr:DUF4864 domain-containing protein [Nitrospiraceae bacterium]
MRRAFLLLMLLGGLGWWYWGRSVEPVRVIHAQLDAIDKGDYAVAYEYLSTAAKEQMTAQDFMTLVQGNSVIVKHYDRTFLSRKVENNVATINGTVEGIEEQVSDVHYVLVKEGERWKIQTFTWSPPRTISRKGFGVR